MRPACYPPVFDRSGLSAASHAAISAPLPVAAVAEPGGHACHPQTLAGIGPVLCLFRSSDDHPLVGWSHARWAMHCVTIDSDGPREMIAFFDALGHACWQLCLLPDSDYLSWDRMVESLPSHTLAVPSPARRARGVVVAAASRIVGRPVWRACPLQLHVVATGLAGGGLAAACARLSEAGCREMRRLAGQAIPVDSGFGLVPS